MWERYSFESIKSQTNSYVDEELPDTTAYDLRVKNTSEGNILFLTLKGSRIPKPHKIEDLKKTILDKNPRLSDIKIEFILTVNL